MQDKIVISISGAAEVSHCGPSVIQKAYELGRVLAKNQVVLSTGATSGFPDYVLAGFKEVGGFALGLSPASTKREHLETYLLPVHNNDVIIYTGFGFPGRDIMLVKSSDAIIIGCGRIGTIHEFTVAWESQIPIGILEGEWPTDEVIKNIIANSNRVNPLVVFDSDPEKLVEKILNMVKKNKQLKEAELLVDNLKAKA